MRFLWGRSRLALCPDSWTPGLLSSLIANTSPSVLLAAVQNLRARAIMTTALRWCTRGILLLGTMQLAADTAQAVLKVPKTAAKLTGQALERRNAGRKISQQLRQGWGARCWCSGQ